jgi:tetratricopeptide (TPR) repeat protein
MNESAPNRWWKQDWFRGLLLLAATLLVYLPAWNGAPVYDDTDHLTPPELRSLTGLARIWTEFGVVSQYYPITHSALWLEHRLWGDAMLGYHLVNLLLHAFAALVLVRILKRLEIPGAWLAGAIFALHPVMAESVAWISELKNTLSGIFYLGAALAYLNFDRTRRGNYFALALFLFVAGLLSKSVIATLPAALLLIFWWKRGRLSWKQDALPLLPFFLIGISQGVLTAWMERKFIGAQGQDFDFTFVERALISGRVIWFYLGKLLWPGNLVFIYPRWQISAATAWQYFFPVATLLIVAALWMLRKRWRGPLAAALFFIGTLFPVLGFLNVYPFRYSFVADHYQYLASVGIIVAASAGIARLLARSPGGEQRVVGTFCGALLATLAILSWQQAHKYRDDETLWRTTIAQNPACFLGYSNLSADLLQRGQVVEAILMGEKALGIESRFAEPHNNLANALREQGRSDDAFFHYQKALQIRPDLAQVQCNVGYILLQRDQLDEAMAHFQRAVQLRPEFVKARINLANVLLRKGRSDEAIVQLRAALNIQPDDPEAHSNLGNALLQKGDWDAAARHLEKALSVQPGNAMAQDDLGNALLQQGRVDEAVVHYQRALALQPDFDLAHYNLGCALFQQGAPVQAIGHFQKALAVQPGFVAAHYQLGNALLQQGQLDDAIVHYEKAVALQPDFANAHLNLAGAFFQKGKGDQVLLHSRAALQLQPDNPGILSSMAWLLATWPEASIRNGAEAIRLANHANELTGGRDLMTLRALAAAFAEAGQFADATTTAQRALELAATQSDIATANDLRAQIGRYRVGSPFRDAIRVDASR